MIKVNGEKLDMAGKTVEELITSMGYQKNRIAVEKNGDIVPKSDYENTFLCDGDSVEVVSFVGGG